MFNLVLFFAEWFRGAFLVSFLPGYSVDRLYLTPWIVGVAVSVHYLADTLIKIAIGYAMDRYGSKLVLHGGFALALGGLALGLAAKEGGMILLSSGLTGIGLSPVWLVCLQQVQGEKRGQKIGLLYAYWMAGLGLGPIMLNFALDADWRLAGLALAVALLAGWTFAAFGRLRTVQQAIYKDTMAARERMRSILKQLKRNRIFLPAILLQTTGAGMVVPYLNLFASDRLGLTHGEISIAVLLGGSCMVLLLVPMGKWYDLSGNRWFLIGGFGLFSVSLAALTNTRTLGSAVVLVLIMGFAYAMLLPAWNAFMSRQVPDESPGMGWGVLSSIEGVGIVAGPLIGSWVAAHGGLTAPFRTSAILFGLIGVTYFLMPGDLFVRNRSMAAHEVR